MKEFDIKVSISKTECANIKANSEEELLIWLKKDAILKYGSQTLNHKKKLCNHLVEKKWLTI